jgi:hypothetical protein
MPSVSKSISTKTGVKPVCNTDAMSDTHVKGGTIISPPSGYIIFNIVIERRLADAPEFTNTEYLIPNQSDQPVQTLGT